MPRQLNSKFRLFSLPILLTALLINPVLLSLTNKVQAAPANKGFQVQQIEKISPILKVKQHRQEERVIVIVSLKGPMSGRLNAFLAQNGVQRRREMKALGNFSLSLPFGLIDKLAAFPEVERVSSNEVVHAMGHVSTTTGTVAGQAAAVTAGRGSIDGSGVPVAVLDSGIDVNHAQFSQSGGGSRVIASVDLTGENRTDDPYGHGTFVAAAAAGGAGAGSAYTG
ncbi:MAG TPA: S8 family serine peptidase, partial [Pyrinomonadaceae bacterium]|nr:S8 family serine peptidase [Pyrinomonadaceae bacterium]